MPLDHPLGPDGAYTITHKIETQRLILQPFAPTHWQDFQILAQDWKAAPGPDFDKWQTSDESCQESVAYLSTQDNYFAMCLRDSGKLIGLLAINQINAQRQADLGHVILSQYQNNDLDQEALHALIQHCFESRGVLSIITHNAPKHTAQLAPLKSLGFVNTNPTDPGELTLTKAQWTTHPPTTKSGT
jgi:RimJ/RimL family protein N-acetyltransferase